MCDYQGYEFGAGAYPDSVCLEGRLFDADYCDDQGNLYDKEDDVPCPMCRKDDAVKWHIDQWGLGDKTYKERRKVARSLVADIRRNRKNGTEPWKGTPAVRVTVPSTD